MAADKTYRLPGTDIELGFKTMPDGSHALILSDPDGVIAVTTLEAAMGNVETVIGTLQTAVENNDAATDLLKTAVDTLKTSVDANSLAVINSASTPTRISAATAVIGNPVHSVGAGLSDLVKSGVYTAILDHVYTFKKTGFTPSTGAVVFTGSGLNDATSGGTYTGVDNPSANHSYKVTVSTADATDKFTWSKDGGPESAEIEMTGGAQVLELGVTVTFGLTTGHTLAEFWTIAITCVDNFQWKKDSGAYSGDVAMTGAPQVITDGVSVTWGAVVGHTLNNEWTVSVAAGTAVKATTGIFHSVIINNAGTAAKLRIYNGTNSSGVLLYTSDALAVGLQRFDVKCSTGIYVVVYDSGAYPDMIVGWN